MSHISKKDVFINRSYVNQSQSQNLTTIVSPKLTQESKERSREGKLGVC